MQTDGDGTKQDPYRIKNIVNLQAINQDLSAHYVLVNNIDASNLKPEEFEPIGDFESQFTGTLNGNNYEIQNLCIKRPTKQEAHVGLFGCIGDEGQVRNLCLTNAVVEGKNSVGSLVGRNGGKIGSSYAIDVDVSGEVHVGGLAGSNCGKIESSYLIGGNVSGEIHIGGLVSWNRSGKIESSYLIGGNVSGEINVGVFDSTNIVGAYLESCSTVSRLDDSNISENPDLELSRGNHRLSYVVESNTLYIHVSDEIYSCSVSPTQVQLLVDDTSEVEMNNRFRASVVEET